MLEQSPQRNRIAVWLDRAILHVGHVAFWCVVVAVLAELLSIAALSVYYGSYLRLPIVVPQLADYRDLDQSRLSLQMLLDDDLRRASRVYDGQPWAQEFGKEYRTTLAKWRHRYEPFRMWGNAEVHGQYINVDEGALGAWRRTINACTGPQTPTARMLVFGGSTVLGVETPDFATLPSYLAHTLNADGRDCVHVTNLGVMGYVLNQETILLTQLLRAGHRPDIVIFYDGANDAYTGAYVPAVASAHADLSEIKTRVESSVYADGILEKSYAVHAIRGVLRRLVPSSDDAGIQQGDAATWSEDLLRVKSEETLDNYEANLSLIQALSKAYGFKAYFFWQPMLSYGSRNRTLFEEVFMDHPKFNDKDENRVLNAVYREAERRAAVKGTFVFLGRVFDRDTDPLYVDSIHLGARGNQILAETIARLLRADWRTISN